MMRVKDLIEKLSDKNPNAHVYIYFDGYTHRCINDSQGYGGLVLEPKKIEEYTNEGKQVYIDCIYNGI